MKRSTYELRNKSTMKKRTQKKPKSAATKPAPLNQWIRWFMNDTCPCCKGTGKLPPGWKISYPAPAPDLSIETNQ